MMKMSLETATSVAFAAVAMLLTIGDIATVTGKVKIKQIVSIIFQDTVFYLVV